jgi:hypothetical protein
MKHFFISVLKKLRLSTWRNYKKNNLKNSNMSEQQIGVKETREAVDFFATLITSVVDTVGDGKVNWYEFAKFTEAARKLPAAVGNYKAIPAEIDDLDDAEVQELIKTFSEALKLEDIQLELFAERGVSIAIAITAFIADIVQYRRSKEG